MSRKDNDELLAWFNEHYAAIEIDLIGVEGGGNEAVSTVLDLIRLIRSLTWVKHGETAGTTAITI